MLHFEVKTKTRGGEAMAGMPEMALAYAEISKIHSKKMWYI